MFDSLPYLGQLVVFIGVFGILAASLNLVMGYGGMFTISHAALFGFGAYATAVAEVRWGLGFLSATVFAMAVSALIGAATSFPAVRLRGDYLIVASLAVQIVGLTLFVNMDSVTNGPAGITRIPMPEIGPLAIDGTGSYVVLTLVLFALVLVLMRMWVRSPWGRLLTAVRDDDIAAMSLGKNVTMVKVTAFALSAAVAGLAGGLYADYVTYINPDSFTLERSVVILAALIIGGMGTLYGCVVGALTVIVLPEVLRLVPMPSNVAASLQQLVYGALLVAFMLFRPQGIAARVERVPEVPEDTGRAPAGFDPAALADARPGPPPPVDRGGSGAAPLRVVGVSKNFGGLAALSDVSFTVPAGQVMGVIGPNGAGKTTMLDVVTGFVSPDRGEVYVDGRPVLRRAPSALARAGMVRLFQEARVFPRMSLRDNVLVGFGGQHREDWHRFCDPRPSVRRRERDLAERAEALLDRVGLRDKADHPAGALSYGQQKLLCLVRALATDPTLLLLDEPCVGLALPMIETLRQFVFSLVEEGRTVVIIEHNLEFVRTTAHSVVFMHEGRVETVGEPAVVLGDERLGRVYFGLSV